MNWRFSMPPDNVTELLRKWKGGDAKAVEELACLVYGELRQLAHRYLRKERPVHTWQSTELVHEAYLRLIDQREANWHDRTHFFAVSAQIMRRILVDHARAKLREKRGGGVQ